MLAIIDDLGESEDAGTTDRAAGAAVAASRRRGGVHRRPRAARRGGVGDARAASRAARRPARRVPYAAVGRERIAEFSPGDVAVVVVLSLALDGAPAHLRHLVRRLRVRLPDTPIVAGVWREGDASVNHAELQKTVGADVVVTSLRGGGGRRYSGAACPGSIRSRSSCAFSIAAPLAVLSKMHHASTDAGSEPSDVATASMNAASYARPVGARRSMQPVVDEPGPSAGSLESGCPGGIGRDPCHLMADQQRVGARGQPAGMPRLADGRAVVERPQQVEEAAHHARVEDVRRRQLHQQRPALLLQPGAFRQKPLERGARPPQRELVVMWRGTFTAN